MTALLATFLVLVVPYCMWITISMRYMERMAILHLHTHISNIARRRRQVLRRVPKVLFPIAIANPPADLSAIQVYRQNNGLSLDYQAIAGWYAQEQTLYPVLSPLADGLFTIPASSVTNGVFQLPTSNVPSFYNYNIWVQTIRSNGLASGWASLAEAANPYNAIANTPFVDARQQMKDNLRFLLRAATDDSPFAFSVDQGSANNIFPMLLLGHSAITFIQACLVKGRILWGDFDALHPIHANSFYKNFVFDQSNLSSDGMVNTTCEGGGSYDAGGFYLPCLIISNFPAYYFNVANYLTNNGSIPSSQISTNVAKTLLPNDSGVTSLPGGTFTVGEQNFYGLNYISKTFAYVTNSVLVVKTYHPGDNLPSGLSGVEYNETVQPVLTNAGYYFARPDYDSTPEQNGFATTNETPIIVQGVGTSQQIAGYAQLGIQNGYPDEFAYLGQYFDQAYTFDASGNITSTNGGVLSPYGNFFATRPGAVALVTMPDIDPPYQKGTCTVYCVSLQLDANHDGAMDEAYNGKDWTSLNSPFVFWRNNNFDRYQYDFDDATNYDDDAAENSAAAYGPYQQMSVPDCNYVSPFFDSNGRRALPSERDLEDFARLWVCGVTTNLLAALPTNTTVTLSWGDLTYTNPNNPTIDVFASVEADGGTGYLTNGDLSSLQFYSSLGQTNSSYVGRLGPGQSIQLNPGGAWMGNHFIWCGVSNGTGGLTLTIADGSGNALATTTAYIKIEDIKEMYERWTVGDDPAIAPSSVATNAVNDLAANSLTFPFNYNPPQD